MKYLTLEFRLRTICAFGAAVLAASLLAGCSQQEATKAVEQTQEAPGVYGQAINRAKAVAGTEEQHGSQGYLDRQSGAGKGDAGDTNVAPK